MLNFRSRCLANSLAGGLSCYARLARWKYWSCKETLKLVQTACVWGAKCEIKKKSFNISFSYPRNFLARRKKETFESTLSACKTRASNTLALSAIYKHISISLCRLVGLKVIKTNSQMRGECDCCSNAIAVFRKLFPPLPTELMNAHKNNLLYKNTFTVVLSARHIMKPARVRVLSWSFNFDPKRKFTFFYHRRKSVCFSSLTVCRRSLMNAGFSRSLAARGRVHSRNILSLQTRRTQNVYTRTWELNLCVEGRMQFTDSER